MQAVYFFIDGSALTAQVRQIWRALPDYRAKRLDVAKLVLHFMDALEDLHEGSWKRVVFYFPVGDEAAIEQYLVVPDYQKPGEVRDLHFKFCGHKLKKSAEFDKFVEQTVPSKFQSRFSKSEKGIDIEICCDALKLASLGKIERLFLFTNDSDFIPLCRALRDFGSNVSILHLSAIVQPNQDLLRETDTYDVVAEASMANLFVTSTIEQDVEVTEAGSEPISEKPDAEPLNLKLELDAEAEATGGDGEAGDSVKPNG